MKDKIIKKTKKKPKQQDVTVSLTDFIKIQTEAKSKKVEKEK